MTNWDKVVTHVTDQVFVCRTSQDPYKAIRKRQTAQQKNGQKHHKNFI